MASSLVRDSASTSVPVSAIMGPKMDVPTSLGGGSPDVRCDDDEGNQPFATAQYDDAKEVSVGDDKAVVSFTTVTRTKSQ
jgi:hypothetical protein